MKKLNFVIILVLACLLTCTLSACLRDHSPNIPDITLSDLLKQEDDVKKKEEDSAGLEFSLDPDARPLKVVKALERKTLTPWEFVEKYRANTVTENVYFYKLHNNFELTIVLGETWADTAIRLYDKLTSLGGDLCRDDTYSLSVALEYRNYKDFMHSYTLKSPNGEDFVTVKDYYTVKFKPRFGVYTYTLDRSQREMLINGKKAILNQTDRTIITTDKYEEEYYEKSGEVVWHPTKNAFVTSGKKVRSTVDKYGSNRETLYLYVYIYDCDTGKGELLTEEQFCIPFADEAKYVSVSDCVWSPCGRYFAVRFSNYDLGKYVAIYDTETKEIIPCGDLEMINYGYSGTYYDLCPPELDWEEAYAIIEANRGN